MSSRRRFAHCFALTLPLIAGSVSQAGDVLENVPAGALGFVVVRNLESADEDVERLIQNLQLDFPGPLAFVKATTGIAEGLDPRGDFLLAVLPGEKPADRPHFAVWMPVTDYENFLSTFEGAGNDRITAVTLAGEDLLVAKHGDWAIVMDPDRRVQMERMLVATQAGAPRATPSTWQSWIDANDTTVVLLPKGIRAIAAWAATSDAASVAGEEPVDPTADELFGPPGDDNPGDPAARRGNSAGDQWTNARRAIRSALKEMPDLGRWIVGASAVACGVRLDDAGNAVGGLRVAWQTDSVPVMADWLQTTPNPTIPFFRNQDAFIVAGGGTMPTSLAVAASSGYARFLLKSVEQDTQGRLDRRDQERFIEAMEQAAGDVTSVALLTLPGEKPEGVYTNRFAAVRVKSSADFVDHVNEVMRLWNEMNHDVQGELRLVFDAGEIQIGDHKATEHSIDMTAAMGTPGVPEIRDAMEKLFGAEGKLRLLVVPVDEKTVMLAGATREQVTDILTTLSFNESPNWNAEEFAEANRLLPEQSAWRLFFSPHGYNTWLKRQTDAVVGPVIGGPMVRDFPPSPPIGVAGGFGEREMWVDVAIPVSTIDRAATYIKKR